MVGTGEHLALKFYDSYIESGFCYKKAAKKASKEVGRSPQAVYVQVRKLKSYKRRKKPDT